MDAKIETEDAIIWIYLNICEVPIWKKEAPLAARMRPRTLDEVVGQNTSSVSDKLLYAPSKQTKISSIIFYGPPGTGKTTLAKVIANTTSAEFRGINATVAGKRTWKKWWKRLRNCRECTENVRSCLSMRSTVLIKDSRDYLLPCGGRYDHPHWCNHRESLF